MFSYRKGKNGYELKKAYDLDAGFDICSSEDIEILPMKKAIIGTDLFLQIPSGFYGRIASRSGLSAKFDIEVGAGVIDSGFRNELKVILRNFGSNVFNVKKGDRIAQLILTAIYTGNTNLIEELNESERGQKGFGSSGI